MANVLRTLNFPLPRGKVILRCQRAAAAATKGKNNAERFG